MLKLTQIGHAGQEADDSLTLTFEIRQKSRFPATTDKGLAVGVFLERGKILRSGDKLIADDGMCIVVQAAQEPVAVVRSDDQLMFARACYHLGNRHTALQIAGGELRYLQDHVLDHMLQGLGLSVTHDNLPFEPEAGAYHSHDH